MKRKMGQLGLFLLSFLLGFSLVLMARAADAPVESPQLQKCLKRADDVPDFAAVEAAAWIMNGGGNEAHLCRAFAQSNRGMHADSAREFWYLASLYSKTDVARAVTMHNMSGQEFLSAKDAKNALAQYAAALKIAPTNTDSLIGHAECHMETERYWDAVDDLNRVLRTDPKNVIALRQRGRAWVHLGNDKNAQEDFGQAESLDGKNPAD